eukprot:TRINITY_DN331_c0_g3_i1.p1 TRINITY_DN331_c0_g3~~TRINITY_DN331_c0_g3_i1.p1  ORF type:complete len:352 (+),score=162.22 TRINITY_DN331_c0_g3_i1:158-1057(+)
MQLRVGDWMLEKALGQGSYGAVRRVRHRKTGQAAAMKCLDKKRLEEEDLANAKKEAYLGTELQHKHLVKVLEVLENEQGVFIVQELAAGGDLHHYVPKDGLAEDEAAAAFAGVLHGLLYMHGRGVAHLDIKPRNVLRGVDGVVKLCDFGLSASQEVQRRPDITSGTLRFAAPEILRGEAQDGYAADMWACGVTLYHMLVGTTPWVESEGAGEKGLRAQIEAAEFTVPAHVSAEARHLIRWLMAADPFARPIVEDALAHPWVKRAAEAGAPKGLQKLRHVLSLPTLKLKKLLKKEKEAAL